MNRFVSVLFDVNHTLIAMRRESDVQEEAIGILNLELNKRIATPIDLETFMSVYKTLWRENMRRSYSSLTEVRYECLVADVFKRFDLSTRADELEVILQTYMQPLYDAAYVVPNMDLLIDSVRPYAKIGVITNYLYANGMREMLRRVGLLDKLDTVVVSSDVGCKKPCVPIYQVALEKLGSAGSQTLMVANELEKDLWQAKQLGLTTVLLELGDHGMVDPGATRALLREHHIGTTNVEADYTVYSVAELQDLISMLITNAGAARVI